MAPYKRGESGDQDRDGSETSVLISEVNGAQKERGHKERPETQVEEWQMVLIRR